MNKNRLKNVLFFSLFMGGVNVLKVMVVTCRLNVI